MSNFIKGHTFDGAVGLKTGAELEEMVEDAVFAPASGALDQTTVEEDSNGRARLKDLGITGSKINDSVAGDGLEKDVSGNLKVDVDDLTLELVGGELVIKDPTGKIISDGTLEVFDDAGVDRLRIVDLSITLAHMAPDSVNGEKVVNESINFSHWDIDTLTTDETPPVVLGEGLLHIVYEEI